MARSPIKATNQSDVTPRVEESLGFDNDTLRGKKNSCIRLNYCPEIYSRQESFVKKSKCKRCFIVVMYLASSKLVYRHSAKETNILNLIK